MNRICKGLMLAGSLLAGAQANAGDLLQWQNNSLTYLYGKDFAINPEIQQTVTFEHADAWKYGDNFLFIDKIFYNGKRTATSARTPITASSAHDFRSARSLIRSWSSARSRMYCWP